MSIYDTDKAPAQPFTAVEAIRDALAASSNIVTANFIEDADHVYRHWHPEDVPKRFLVVRELNILGGRISNHGKIDDVDVQVMAAIGRHLDNGQIFTEVHRYLAAIHKRVHDEIVGTSPALLRGTVLLPIRLEVYPSSPELDADFDFWFSTAQYNITLDGI